MSDLTKNELEILKNLVFWRMVDAIDMKLPEQEEMFRNLHNKIEDMERNLIKTNSQMFCDPVTKEYSIV